MCALNCYAAWGMSMGHDVMMPHRRSINIMSRHRDYCTVIHDCCLFTLGVYFNHLQLFSIGILQFFITNILVCNTLPKVILFVNFFLSY